VVVVSVDNLWEMALDILGDNTYFLSGSTVLPVISDTTEVEDGIKSTSKVLNVSL